MVARDQVLVLNLDTELGLPTHAATDEYSAPVPAIACLVKHIRNTAVEQLTRVASFSRGVEKLEHAFDRVELGFAGGADPPADLECMRHGIVYRELFHL